MRLIFVALVLSTTVFAHDEKAPAAPAVEATASGDDLVPLDQWKCSDNDLPRPLTVSALAFGEAPLSVLLDNFEHILTTDKLKAQLKQTENGVNPRFGRQQLFQKYFQFLSCFKMVGGKSVPDGNFFVVAKEFEILPAGKIKALAPVF